MNLNFANLAQSGAQQTGINMHPAIPYVQPEMNTGIVLSSLGADISFLQNDFCNILSSIAADIFISTGVSYDQEGWSDSNRRRQEILLHNARRVGPSRSLSINLTDSDLPTQLNASTAALAAGGGALMYAASLAPTILGAGLFAGITGAGLLVGGVILILAGAALVYYSVRIAIRSAYRGNTAPPCHGAGCPWPVRG